LNAGAVEEGNEESVDCGCPLKAAAEKIELFNDKRVKQSGEVGTGGHANAGEGLFDGAGPADAESAFNDEDALGSAGEIRSAGEAIVSGTHDDAVPRYGRKFTDRNGEPDFAEDCRGR